MELKLFYYNEWHSAKLDGNKSYADSCKEKYMELVMSSILKPYHFYIDKLKRFETIILN